MSYSSHGASKKIRRSRIEKNSENEGNYDKDGRPQEDNPSMCKTAASIAATLNGINNAGAATGMSKRNFSTDDEKFRLYGHHTLLIGKTNTKSEKRLKRFRSKPSISISERIKRAKSQRLFLIHTSDVIQSNDGPYITLSVLGSTGNVYKVTLSNLPSCSCPDHAGGNLCKHILFVMLKVVGLPKKSQLVYQNALLTSEIEVIFDALSERRTRLGMNILANKAVQERFASLKSGEDVNHLPKDVGRNKIEGDCPICFESLGMDESILAYCRQTCGVNFHVSCMKMWASKCQGEPTCPACRQPWTDVQSGGRKRKINDDEGYTNLGDLQGLSRIRDASSYSCYEYR